MKRVPGLYKYKDKRTGKIYYSCKHPKTGKRVGLGTHRQSAIRVFNRLTVEYEQDREKALWDRIHSTSAHTFKQLVDEKYLPAIQERRDNNEIAENTLKNRKYVVNNVLLPRFGNKPVDKIEVIDIADLLEEYKKQDKNRMAQNIRSITIDVFIEAISAGWTKENPAAITRNPRAKVKRSRLTLDRFMQIYDLAKTKEPWLCRMMELAVVTSHAGCTELSVMQPPLPDENFMRIERTKNIERVKVPLELTLKELNWNLGNIVEKCMSTGITSQFLLHHTTDKGNCGKGKKMHHYRLTRRFTELVRECNIDWGKKLPATLYEIRSLSARLYDKQKLDIQSLMAHKDPRSTERYIDSRGAEWKVLKL